MAPSPTRRRRLAVAGICCAAALLLRDSVHACTAFCAIGKDEVLVGNNEDYSNPKTKLWFVQAKAGSFGRMLVGFDDLVPQGGMNERGLWFDGFAAPPQKVSSALPSFNGNIVHHALSTCSTVDEVVELFSRYNRSFLSEAILMFADASGDAVSIEANAIVRKSRAHFVQTNFHQSRAEGSAGDRRFETATAMLERAGNDVSVDLFRRILASTYQKGPFPTLYSNIYELRSRTMHLYYFHDFERVMTFKLDDELRKGERVIDIASLFPPNAAAATFAARRQPPAVNNQGRSWLATQAGVAIILLTVVVAVVRGGRRVRAAIAAGVGVVVVAIVAVAVVLSVPQASPGWVAFSLGTPSGRNTHIGPNIVRSEGISLKAAVATAYDVPPIRVIAPDWMNQGRYSINAVGPTQSPADFRALLQQELVSRLQLTVHREMRPFDVFVLTAVKPRLTAVDGTNVRVWVRDWGMEVQDGAMANVASALQSVLGKPVIDETGLAGRYEMDFEWTEDRVASVTAVLRDRFGLQLTPATRNLEALVVDNARRDAALVLLAQFGRFTSAAPPELRARLSRLLSVH